MVDTSLVGVVMNGLSHFCQVRSRTHFSVCLIRGLGGNLVESAREAFAKEVLYLPFLTLANSAQVIFRAICDQIWKFTKTPVKLEHIHIGWKFIANYLFIFCNVCCKITSPMHKGKKNVIFISFLHLPD